ncbi:MAG: hypothetical protein J2O48_09055 [Solirubrobacterales bacterium]|nr:hypothetical protein [Solirubrobacterales bacterium]
MSIWTKLWRTWLPLTLCVIGVALLIVKDFSAFGVDAFAAFVGAGSSVWLTNVLWRMGISGNQDRDDEEDARQYLALHGHWPDEHR